MTEKTSSIEMILDNLEKSSASIYKEYEKLCSNLKSFLSTSIERSGKIQDVEVKAAEELKTAVETCLTETKELKETAYTLFGTLQKKVSPLLKQSDKLHELLGILSDEVTRTLEASFAK
ncbi:hypothetical protein ADUPG1_006886 [Aduncisulcus paluster]|uniref:Uncharacterized protein n=1 Tax=Aduncisulcus paluster TaxID=2918883 RepID=A0ABQ5KLL7_9EUKA|nr:hypothetical protein ADUPG1_006886 [Aduncisulcus paluster]